MKKSKIILITIVSLIMLLIISFSLEYLGIITTGILKVKREEVRREVFEQTQSYVEGKRQSLVKHYNEWRTSEYDEKQAIRLVVLQEFANFDLNKFTEQQKEWYYKITN